MTAEPTSAPPEAPRLCAGCLQPLPEFGRRRIFFKLDDGPAESCHDDDACVAQRNTRRDVRAVIDAADRINLEAIRHLDKATLTNVVAGLWGLVMLTECELFLRKCAANRAAAEAAEKVPTCP